MNSFKGSLSCLVEHKILTFILLDTNLQIYFGLGTSNNKAGLSFKAVSFWQKAACSYSCDVSMFGHTLRAISVCVCVRVKGGGGRGGTKEG